MANKKRKGNTFSYSTKNAAVSGFFNIYQARNGLIYIVMGNQYTSLTLRQVNELAIRADDLEDFDRLAFEEAYHLGENR